MITDDLDALRTRLVETVMLDNPSLVVIFDNQPNVEPPVNDLWCRFVQRPGFKSVVEGGATKRYQQLGISILQIVVPAQFGDTIGYELAEQCDLAFRDWRSADKAVTVYQTDYRTVPQVKNDEPLTINYSIYWKSIRP